MCGRLLIALALLGASLHGQTKANSAARPPVADSDHARSKVVVYAPSEESAILPLLRAELVDLGLEVVEYDYTGDPTQVSAPFSSAPEGDVRAAFRIIVHRSGIELRILDKVTNQVTLREVFATADGTPIQARTAVLHTVELLRWTLRDSEPSSRLSATTRPPPPPPPAAVVRPKVWFISLSPTVLYSPGGTDPGAGAAFDLTWQKRRLGMRLFGATALLPNTLSVPEGTAVITPRFAGLEALLHVSSSSRSGCEIGAGISVISIRLRGTAEPVLQTHEDHLLTAAPLLEARAHYTLGESVSLVANTMALTPLRSDIIRVDNREVGRYGRLLLSFGVGLRASLH